MNRERYGLCRGFESLSDPAELKNRLECGDGDSEAQEREPFSKVTGLVSGRTEETLGRRSPDSRDGSRCSRDLLTRG